MTFKFFVYFGLLSNVVVTILLLFHLDEIIAGQSVNGFFAFAQVMTGFASAGILGSLIAKDGFPWE